MSELRWGKRRDILDCRKAVLATSQIAEPTVQSRSWTVLVAPIAPSETCVSVMESVIRAAPIPLSFAARLPTRGPR